MIEFFEDQAGQWRFRVKGANGEIVAQSEGYSSRQAAHAGAEALCRIMANWNPATDLVSEWMDEECALIEGAEEIESTLWLRFARWLIARDLGLPVINSWGSLRFARALSSRGLERHRAASGSFVRLGIRLHPKAESGGG